MFRLFSIATLTLVSSFSMMASAFPTSGYETRNLGGNLIVGEAQTQTINLDRARYIKNLVVQAEGVRTDSIVEVMVNGQIKGTLYAPGRDPSYVVTIAETARTIEFRHRSGGSMRIIQVVGTLSKWGGSNLPIGGGFHSENGQIQALASSTIAQVQTLSAFANAEDYMTSLFPIKKNAGLVLVMSEAHGDLSRRTQMQLVALMDQIDFARGYLNQLIQQDDAFEAVVELLTIRETLGDMMD